MAEKKNGNGAGTSDEKADEPVKNVADDTGRPLSLFEIARNANIRHESERVAKAEIEEAERTGVERKAGRETTEFVESPFSLALHPDGTEKKMVICRPNGTGEREITLAEWDRIQANPNLAPGAWTIRYTEVIGPNHSSDF